MNRTLFALIIADGYLAAASEHPDQLKALARLQTCADGEPFEVVKLASVPRELADQLNAQGCSGQHFGDGYLAMRAAAPYVAEVWWAEGEPYSGIGGAA